MSADFDRALTLALPALRIQAARLTKNAADTDDLMQQTALTALQGRDRYAEIGNMKAWLSRIMMNQYLNQARMAKSRIQIFQTDDIPEIAVKPRGELAAVVAGVRRAVESLSPHHRSALMQDAAGFSYLEIAAADGINIGTVKSRINRARAALNAMGEFV